MDKLINLFFAPKKVFEVLKEKPEWVTPLIIVLVVLAIATALTLIFTKDLVLVKQEEIMRERGMTDEQIDRARRFMTGPGPCIFGTMSAVIVFVVIFLIFAALINLLIPLFDGTASFKHVFSVICYSSLVKVPASILRLILVVITGSPYISTSLSLLVPGMAKEAFSYRVLSGFDFFMVWEMVLVSLGISITTQTKKEKAYLIVFLIWIISIFVGASLGLVGRR